MNRQEYIVSEHGLQSFSGDILPVLSTCRIVLLYGPMGAGKTRFVRSLGQILGFEHEVGSPTFSLINEYQSEKNNWGINRIYHMDLFRLKNMQEALDIGIMDYFDGPELCIVEWPELIVELIGDISLVTIQIEVLENQQRKFILTV